MWMPIVLIIAGGIGLVSVYIRKYPTSSLAQVLHDDYQWFTIEADKGIVSGVKQIIYTLIYGIARIFGWAAYFLEKASRVLVRSMRKLSLKLHVHHRKIKDKDTVHTDLFHNDDFQP